MDMKYHYFYFFGSTGLLVFQELIFNSNGCKDPQICKFILSHFFKYKRKLIPLCWLWGKMGEKPRKSIYIILIN